MDKDGLYDELCRRHAGVVSRDCRRKQNLLLPRQRVQGLGLLDLVRIDTVSAY